MGPPSALGTITCRRRTSKHEDSVRMSDFRCGMSGARPVPDLKLESTNYCVLHQSGLLASSTAMGCFRPIAVLSSALPRPKLNQGFLVGPRIELGQRSFNNFPRSLIAHECMGPRSLIERCIQGSQSNSYQIWRRRQICK